MAEPSSPLFMKNEEFVITKLEELKDMAPP